MEEYPSTEQITAVISSQNDDTQPDQPPLDGSTNSDPLKNEPTPLVSLNLSTSEQEKGLELTFRGKSRVTSSQNAVSSTTNSVSTSALNYTLPEFAEEGENRRAKVATNESSVDVISSGISDLKLSPTQVSVENYFLAKLVALIHCFTVATTSVIIDISVTVIGWSKRIEVCSNVKRGTIIKRNTC